MNHSATETPARPDTSDSLTPNQGLVQIPGKEQGSGQPELATGARAIVEDIDVTPQSAEDFLLVLGKRVREIRDRRGMTRKLVARDAGVSERHLAHLEAGEGNVSIVILRNIAMALDVSLVELLLPESEDTVEKRLIRRFLEHLPRPRLEEVVFRLMRDFGLEESARRKRIALIGLRGAGKSTLGRQLAAEMNVNLFELDKEVEREIGMPIEEIFALYGQAGYRRAEKRALERVLRENKVGVFSVGSGIVSEPETYDLLLSRCFTVWVKAQPEEHMSRVLSQGDFRPMAGNEEAMEDLKRILNAREPLYQKADVTLDTAGENIQSSFVKLKQLVHRA